MDGFARLFVTRRTQELAVRTLESLDKMMLEMVITKVARRVDDVLRFVLQVFEVRILVVLFADFANGGHIEQAIGAEIVYDCMVRHAK